MKAGYFLAFRSVWKHPAFKNVIESALWLYIVSNASHQEKELKFLGNPIFVKRGELIFPLRKNASIWKMPYSSMRLFIHRLKRKKMITTRIATMQPHNNHKYKSVTIISVSNYDKFQQYDLTPDQYKTTSHALLNNKLNNNTNLLGQAKVVNSEDKIVGTWGEYNEIIRNGKKYLVHKWKNEEKEY